MITFYVTQNVIIGCLKIYLRVFISLGVQILIFSLIQSGINGRIADVEYLYARSDGYFWPQCKVSVKSIQEQMIYYLNNIDRIKVFKKEARIYAEQNLNWKDRYMQVCEILKNATIAPYKEDLVDQIKCFEHRKTGKFNVLPYAFYYWKKLKG